MKKGQFLTIQVVGWNSEETLLMVVAGLKKVPGEVLIRYIDNASEDDSVALVRDGLPNAEIIELPENVGFTNAHNIGLAVCESEFVLTHDPDLELEWSGIERLLEVMSANPTIGAAQGKLLRADGKTIDSAGIAMTLTRNGRERGGGEIDSGQWNTSGELDAVTGACGLYRMKAAREVAHVEYEVVGHTALEVFDKDFFAYKDDVDLGWRLRTAAWKCWYEPVVAGKHRRSVGVEGVLGWGLKPGNIIKRLRAQRTRLSFRNYVWMLMKNMRMRDEVLYDWFIIPRVLVFLGLSCIYWPLFGVWVEIGRGGALMLKKRAEWLNHAEIV